MINSIKAFIATTGGFIVYWLGGLDILLTCLLTLIIVDYITGILSAIYNSTLNSSTGWRGIVKKVMTLLIIVVAFAIETATGNMFAIREICIMFFTVNEAFSIIENASKMGLNIPKKLTDVLEQLKGKGK